MKYKIYADKSSYIHAADDDFEEEEDFDMYFPDDSDADDLEDEEFEEEPEEEVEEDEPTIDIDNNIGGRYIAECDRCHGIFISSVSESDSRIDCISGICPLCDHQSSQYLKWVIKSVED